MAHSINNTTKGMSYYDTYKNSFVVSIVMILAFIALTIFVFKFADGKHAWKNQENQSITNLVTNKDLAKKHK